VTVFVLRYTARRAYLFAPPLDATMLDGLDVAEVAGGSIKLGAE